MIDADKYWSTLTVGQQRAVDMALENAESRGEEIVIVDAYDIWALIPKALRPENPPQ